MEVLVIPLPSTDFNSGFFGCYMSATSRFPSLRVGQLIKSIIKSKTYYNVTIIMTYIYQKGRKSITFQG